MLYVIMALDENKVWRFAASQTKIKALSADLCCLLKTYSNDELKISQRLL